MPNPVAANDLQPISGSLQTSRISYGVETAGKNYGQDYNGTTWYSDIPNNGQFYTIISDNYTANYYVSRSNAGGAYVEGGLPAVDEYSAPVFWTTVGTSSLDVITIVNGLPDRIGQTPFSSGSQALNWIASSSNYFAVGPDYYAQIDADKLLMYVEGNQIISYPTTGSTWYDISGYNALGNLVNGPTYNSNGWLTFDGADDYVNLGNSSVYSAGNQLSAFAWVYINSNSVYQVIMSKIAGGYVTGWELANSSGVLRATMRGADNNLSAGGLTVGRWYYVGFTYDGLTLSLYRNGELQGTNNGASTLNSTADLNIATRFNGSNPFNGNIAGAQLYSGSLSLSNIQQNYYGGPIVTDDLEFAIDAGNLVSYPKTGTTAYDLTGNTNATLRNGTGFSTKFGGTWVFDGTDDYIDVSGVFDFANSNAVTVECWARSNNPTWNDFGYLVSRRDQFIIHPQSGSSAVYFYINTGGGNWNGISISSVDEITSFHHYALTYDGNAFTAYVDGKNIGTTATGLGPITNDTDIVAIGWDEGIGGRKLDGDIASVRLYRRALTAAEVLQNYNATK